ncbi:MAG: hypothetical protein R2867_32840 [Caldilineaceae bacterium]
MIRILFLAANPVDQARLRVRAEFNGVRQVLDVTAAHDRFQLIPEFDATPDELQDLLTRHRPQIIHFSGHGTTAGLLFADQDGEDGWLRRRACAISLAALTKPCAALCSTPVPPHSKPRPSPAWSMRSSAWAMW